MRNLPSTLKVSSLNLCPRGTKHLITLFDYAVSAKLIAIRGKITSWTKGPAYAYKKRTRRDDHAGVLSATLSIDGDSLSRFIYLCKKYLANADSHLRCPERYRFPQVHQLSTKDGSFWQLIVGVRPRQSVSRKGMTICTLSRMTFSNMGQFITDLSMDWYSLPNGRRSSYVTDN